ncbi:hypothetical protein Sango_2074100 [Sesamum angolense]|uniref:Uncharacterized protein n=1 Tax=Sesamum angolense TaxID=2727404 RepID=A0AAE2BLT5_9LAMI|nr:hypothetical protein Sango_2074100 [Sesamum angolense]
MGIFKWIPTFTSAQESSIILVGVCFPELLAHLFHKDALFTVASMIGASLQIDDFTFNQSKLSKARVGIEIDLTKPLVEEFGLLINGITILQKVEYEQVPKYCSLCKHVGHDNSEFTEWEMHPAPLNENRIMLDYVVHSTTLKAKESKGKEKTVTDKRLVFEITKENGLHAGNYISTANGDKEASHDIVNEINCAETGDPDACCESGAGVNTVGRSKHSTFSNFSSLLKLG